MKNLTFYRTKYSGYFPSNFKEIEEKTLLSLGITPSDNEGGAQILITNTDTYLDQPFSDDVKLIIHPNSGYDNFSKKFIENCPAPIILGNEIRRPAVANYCLKAITQHFIPKIGESSWSKTRQYSRPLLEQLHVAIIGKGQIGTTLGKTLETLVDQVTYFDPFKGLPFPENPSHWGQYDCLVLAAGLNDTSINLIDEKVFEHLKKHALIVNPARGKHVCWKSLISYLNQHASAAAYVDVFPEEPFPIEDYVHLSNLKMTSHIAGVFDGLSEKIIEFEKKVLLDYISLDLKTFEEKYQHIDLRQRIIDGKII